MGKEVGNGEEEGKEGTYKELGRITTDPPTEGW